MKFCPHCDNMMYIRTTEIEEGPERLTYYCRTCMFETHETLENLKAPVFENTHVDGADEGVLYERFMTPQLERDVALPRTKNVVCPTGCEDNEVIYVKYDAVNMKYLYLCTTCKKFWRSA